MRKLILLLFLILLFGTTYAQGVYLSLGTNISSFNFKSPAPMSMTLKSGSGSYAEMGFSKKMKSDSLSYSLGVNLNEYNAIAVDFANSCSWNTKFLGVSSSIEYSMPIIENFSIMLKGGLNLSTIVYGKQSINGAYFDLVKEEEFSGLNITPYTQIALNVAIQDLGFMSLGYGINHSFLPMNSSDEKLSITTNQIRFGIHFNIK